MYQKIGLQHLNLQGTIQPWHSSHWPCDLSVGLACNLFWPDIPASSCAWSIFPTPISLILRKHVTPHLQECSFPNAHCELREKGISILLLSNLKGFCSARRTWRMSKEDKGKPKIARRENRGGGGRRVGPEPTGFIWLSLCQPHTHCSLASWRIQLRPGSESEESVWE
jgi:hypothetical protein